eukprot:Clim_evm7s173 gene=Clim_evmTU7s173
MLSGKILIALTAIFSVLDTVQAMPPKIEEIDEHTMALSGEIEEGTWTETILDSDGSEVIMTVTIKAADDETRLNSNFEEKGYGCYIVKASLEDNIYIRVQYTHVCLDGEVRVLDTYSYFDWYEPEMVEDPYQVPDGWYNEGGIHGSYYLGLDWKGGNGNVVNRSAIAFKALWYAREIRMAIMRTTFYGYGAWESVMRKGFKKLESDVAKQFNEEYPPTPPQKGTVDVITNGPGKMVLYRDGKIENKPTPWAMNKGTKITLTSDPSKTSQGGWVGLAWPDASGQFSSWSDGNTADKVVTVTMNAQDPWTTDTAVHVEFEEAPSTMYKVDHRFTDFYTGFSYSHPDTFPVYTDQLGFTKMNRVISTTTYPPYVLDVYKLFIDPTGSLYDIDLDLDGSTAGGYPNMPVYNPTIVYDSIPECEHITVSMDTDMGPIRLVYIPAIAEYAIDDNQILEVQSGFREYRKCGGPEDVIIDYSSQEYGIKTFPDAGKWINETFMLVSNGQAPISEHKDGIDPLETREDPNYHWLFDFDRIIGSMNDDFFVGNARDNIFWTNGGNNVATGNAGADTYHLTGGSIMITDFAPTENDDIDIDRSSYSMALMDADYHTHDLVYYHEDGDLYIEIKSSGQTLVMLPGVTMSKSVWEQMWVENDLVRSRYCIAHRDGTTGFCRFDARLD